MPLIGHAVSAFHETDVVAGPIRWSKLGPPVLADMWDTTGYRRMLEQLESAEHRGGAMDSLRITVGCLGHADMWAGRFNDAEVWHSEATDIAVALDGDASIWDMLKVELRGWQGREEETGAAAALLMGDLEIAGAGVFTNLARIALTILDNALGNYEAALATAWPLFEHDYPAQGNQCLPELVEAGVRSGTTVEAQAGLDRLTSTATVAGTPWALGVLARAQALMADDGKRNRCTGTRSPTSNEAR